MLLSSDIQRDGLSVLCERPGGKHHPCVLLCGGIGAQTTRRFNALDRAGNGRTRRSALGGERNERRRIAQRRAVVATAIIKHRLNRRRGKRGGIDALRTTAIAE